MPPQRLRLARLRRQAGRLDQDQRSAHHRLGAMTDPPGMILTFGM
jgi:hypothetical protein